MVAPGSSVSDNRGGPAATDAGLWQSNPDGSIQSITLLEAITPDQTSVAFGLNDAGEVVGRSVTADGQNVTVYWITGETLPELLPVLTEDPGTYVRAWQINNQSLAVGELQNATDTERFATLWVKDADERQNIDLQTFILTESGWDLSGALSINNAGQSVGYGVVDDQQRAFLLTSVAVPEPSAVTAVIVTVRLGLFSLRRNPDWPSA